jgi:hypothetical protein
VTLFGESCERASLNGERTVETPLKHRRAVVLRTEKKKSFLFAMPPNHFLLQILLVDQDILVCEYACFYFYHSVFLSQSKIA